MTKTKSRSECLSEIFAQPLRRFGLRLFVARLTVSQFEVDLRIGVKLFCYPWKAVSEGGKLLGLRTLLDASPSTSGDLGAALRFFNTGLRLEKENWMEMC